MARNIFLKSLFKFDNTKKPYLREVSISSSLLKLVVFNVFLVF